MASVVQQSQTPAGSRRRPRRRLGPFAVVAPGVLYLLLVFVIPVVVFAGYSLLTTGLFTATRPWTLDAYRNVFSTSVNGKLAVNSVETGGVTAILTVSIALPVAYWLRYQAGRLLLPMLFVLVIALLSSYLVRIYSWRTILGENGVLNGVLQGLHITSEPVGFLLFSRFSVVLASTNLYLPFVIILLYAGLRPLEPAYLEAAQDLGANALTRWRKIILPTVAVPIQSAGLFVFVVVSADWFMPSFLGGPGNALLGSRISTAFRDLGDYPLGAALSVLTLLAFAATFALTRGLLRLLGLDRLEWVT